MNKFTLIILLALAGCGVDPLVPNETTRSYAQITAPGAAMPNSTYLLRCNEKDGIGRCKDWNNKSDMCINPKGHDATPPIVPCASINKERNDE